MKRIAFAAAFLSLVSLARAGGVVCEMGGYPKIETPGLVELVQQETISYERLDDIRALQERLAGRIEAIKDVFAAPGPDAVPKGSPVAHYVEADMAHRLRGVCLALAPDDCVFELAIRGSAGMERLPDGTYRPTGVNEPCELCAAVQAASFRPIDAPQAAEGELPGARLARAHEANAVLAAWREGLRAILTAEEWRALESFQRNWLHRTVTSTIADDPRVREACEACTLRPKCSICKAIEEGVQLAKAAKE